MDSRELFKRILYRIKGRVISLYPQGTPKGNVLFSYITLPFLRKENPMDGHTNLWEAREMAVAFVERGYAVDIIDLTNTSFVPTKEYTYFIDIGTNMERLTPLLNKDCRKILHITGAHWQANNEAEEVRLARIEQARGVRLAPDRPIAPNRAIETADMATTVAGEYAVGTFAYAGKTIHCLPLSTTHKFDKLPEKDFAAVSKNFIWFGGAGLVHKGLDLTLEAFASLPDHSLRVYGKIDGEKEFIQAYHKELYETPNIKTVGWISPGSEEFEAACASSVGIVLPSCAEGCAGSVVQAMHTGLIPVVTYETGVPVHDFGVLIEDGTQAAVKEAVLKVSSTAPEKLREMSEKAVRYAKTHHTRGHFSGAYRQFLDTIGA